MTYYSITTKNGKHQKERKYIEHMQFIVHEKLDLAH